MTNSLRPGVYLELHTKFVASYFILWTAFSSQTLLAVLLLKPNIIILLGMTKTSLVVYCLPGLVFSLWMLLRLQGTLNIICWSFRRSHKDSTEMLIGKPQLKVFGLLSSQCSSDNKCDWAIQQFRLIIVKFRVRNISQKKKKKEIR